jgi:hypothetical protein
METEAPSRSARSLPATREPMAVVYRSAEDCAWRENTLSLIWRLTRRRRSSPRAELVDFRRGTTVRVALELLLDPDLRPKFAAGPDSGGPGSWFGLPIGLG